MAFMNQEKKSALAPAIKAVLKKHGVKGSISVENYSALTVTLSSGVIDFGDAYCHINMYHIESTFEDNKAAREFLLELKDAMNVGNFDHSDSQSDYFHVGWYTNINLGKWNKPYTYVAA